MATYRRHRRHATSRKQVQREEAVRGGFDGGVFDEPFLMFGGHHHHIDPKTGLALYGPYSLGRDDQVPLRSITVGIIGTPDLVFRMKSWLRECQGRVTNDGREPFWRPSFPGINVNSCLQCDLVFGDAWQEVIDVDALSKILQIPRYWDLLKAIVEQYTSAIERMLEREPKPTVIVCITPEEIDSSLDTLFYQPSAETQVNGFRLQEGDEGGGGRPTDNPAPSDPINVRRALKAAFMKFDVPTQLVRGSTLGQATSGSRRQRQDDATKAWNLVAGLYYKAGSHLWRLADIQPGTCYVGVSFYRERFSDKPAMRTSLAQIFSHKGDGLILRGRSFEWHRSQGPSPHMPADLAQNLLSDAIKLYTDHSSGAPPNRIVVHKSSRFEPDEKRGFEQAISSKIPQKDFAAIEKRGVQFFRQGYHPPLRCTWVRLAENDYLVYTRGYVPFYRIYPGMRVPQPLEIVEHFGNSPADFVLQETLSLTKMNWNSADLSCEEPITLNFSRRVGDILALMNSDAPIREQYRYYM